MFYLAELLNRLIGKAKYCDWTNFSYKDILDKMMETIFMQAWPTDAI